MKTFYLMQSGALEEYLKESQSNGNGRGNGIDNSDHSGCDGICNSNANQKLKEECGCGEPTASIDSGIALALFVGLIIGIYFLFKHKKPKYEEEKRH